MKQQHTPGPWKTNETGRISAGEIEIGHAFEYELDYCDYCDCHADCTNPPLPRLANASLMAAAPVMLEELGHARHALGLASMAVPKRLRERFAWHSKHLGRMIKLIEGDESNT